MYHEHKLVQDINTLCSYAVCDLQKYIPVQVSTATVITVHIYCAM